MPGNFVFKPRLTDTYSSPSSRPNIVTRPPIPNAAGSGAGLASPAVAIAAAAGARPQVRPVIKQAPAPKKYVSSTHYARYILWQGRQNSELIIESHGLRVIDEKSHVLPPAMALHFYGPDGAALCTPTIDYAFLQRGLAEYTYERIRGGQTYPDYLLSKFELAPERGKHALYNSFINCLDHYDVLSLEQLDDNGAPEALRLSEVIAHLYRQGHRYSKIHCIFCRSISEYDIRRDPALRNLVKPDYAPLPAGR